MPIISIVRTPYLDLDTLKLRLTFWGFYLAAVNKK